MEKTWRELHDILQVGDVIRVVKVIDTEDDDGRAVYTKPYEKALVDKVCDDEIVIIMDEGVCDGYDFYFREDEYELGELMLESDYELFEITEPKIWGDLQSFLPKMKAIEHPSDALLFLIKTLESK